MGGVNGMTNLVHRRTALALCPVNHEFSILGDCLSIISGSLLETRPLRNEKRCDLVELPRLGSEREVCAV